MRELHLLKNAVSPRRERNFGAPQGRDNAEMELGWDRVGLRLGPMLAYVGLSWPMLAYVGSSWPYVGLKIVQDGLKMRQVVSSWPQVGSS